MKKDNDTCQSNCELKEKDLAYGGSALIEGIMMRGKSGLALVVKRPDGTLYKEKSDKKTIGERIKILGIPFVRGISSFIDNIIVSMDVLNKSAEIAFPEEVDDKKQNSIWSKITSFFTFLFALIIAMVIFVGIPRLLPEVANLIFPDVQNFTAKEYPFSYNLVSGLIRMLLFFGYIVLISLLPDMKRVFGYHGAEHKTIHTYEAKKDLTVDNVRESSRLHPRCGTSFMFIVFLITLVVFPFFDVFLNKAGWFIDLNSKLQHLIVIIFHIVIGMPIVASISYEALKLSAKFQKSWLMKIFIAPGLFFQLFTTKNPDDEMIKVGILSLGLVLGDEDVDTPRSVTDDIVLAKKVKSPVITTLMGTYCMMSAIFNCYDR